MKIRVPLWAALLACGCGLLLGATHAPVRAQGQPGKVLEPLAEYNYLPARYGEVYVPSLAEWQALRLTALGASTTRLTEQFSRQHLTCFATPKGLVLTLDLLPQPTWKHYQPGGKFNAPPDTVRPDLQKAVDATMRFVRSFYPEVKDQNILLRLYMHSESIGLWEDGKLLLNGEK